MLDSRWTIVSDDYNELCQACEDKTAKVVAHIKCTLEMGHTFMHCENCFICFVACRNCALFQDQLDNTMNELQNLA
jgi:hypothetical protein